MTPSRSTQNAGCPIRDSSIVTGGKAMPPEQPGAPYLDSEMWVPPNSAGCPIRDSSIVTGGEAMPPEQPGAPYLDSEMWVPPNSTTIQRLPIPTHWYRVVISTEAGRFHRPAQRRDLQPRPHRLHDVATSTLVRFEGAGLQPRHSPRQQIRALAPEGIQ